MLNRERSQQILQLTLPIMGGMISQNVLNLVDMYMVGRLGPAAVAAVGITSYVNWLLAAAFIGLSAGVQAMVARRMGEGRYDIAARPLNGSLLMIACSAIPLAIILILCAPWIISLLTDDPEVAAHGTPYLQARIAGIAAMGMNFSFRAYWSAIKLTRFYFLTLLVMHTINIGINYVLIFGTDEWAILDAESIAADASGHRAGFFSTIAYALTWLLNQLHSVLEFFGISIPAMGTLGAGLGTTISLYIGTLMYFIYAWLNTRQYGFLASLPRRETVRDIIKVSVPACAQQFFFSLGFTVLFWIVGQVGTGELAVANVLTNTLLVAFLPCLAFGLSAATLVGQALGRKEPDDAYRWGWDVAKLALIVVFIISVPMFVFAGNIMHLFIADPAIAELGVIPLRLVAVGLLLDAVGTVLFNSMQGAGATMSTMAVTLGLQWLAFLPLAYLTGPVLGMGLLMIWSLYVGYRAFQTGVFIWLWQRKQWTTIKLN